MKAPVYDDQDAEKSVIRPDLARMEGVSGGIPGQRQPSHDNVADHSTEDKDFSQAVGEEDGDGQAKRGAGLLKGKGEDGSESPEGLRKAEGNAGAGEKTAKLGNGFVDAAAAEVPWSVAVKAFLGRNKKKGGAGTAIVTIIVLIAMGISTIISHQLVSMVKIIEKEVSKIEKKAGKKAAKKVLKKITDRLKEKARASKAERDRMKAEAAADPLLEEIDKMPVTDPAVEDVLKGEGLTVEEGANGGLKGIVDTNGVDITDDIGKGTAADVALDQALPEDLQGVQSEMVPGEVADAGASFKGISEDTKAKDVPKEVAEAVDKGASAAEIAKATANEQDRANSDAAVDPNDPASGEKTTKANGDLGKAIEATNKAISEGKTGAEALTAGEHILKAGTDKMLLTAVATSLCDFKQSVKEASDSRVPTIMKMLTRHMSTMFSIANQIQLGKLKGDQIQAFMKLLNGNRNAKPEHEASVDKKGRNIPMVPSEDQLPFSASAGWQRSVGGNINTDEHSEFFTPDLAEGARPTKSSASKLVDKIDGFMKTFKVNFSCKVLTSKFGKLVQFAVGLFQIAADIGSFGLAQAAITAGLIAFQETLNRVILPQVLKFFTPVGLNGLENSVQWLNNTYVGSVIAFSDYARRSGGLPLAQTTATKLVTEYDEQLKIENTHRSWQWRTLAYDNPDSLMAKVAVNIPTSMSALATNIASFFTHMPSMLAHEVAGLFTFRTFATAGKTSPGSDYGITDYGFTDTDLKYDTAKNSTYLHTDPVHYNGVEYKRVDLAGDPMKFPGGAIDSSTTDLLHCFRQGYDETSIMDPKKPADKICGTVGNFDYDQWSGDKSKAPPGMNDDNVAEAYCQSIAAATPGVDVGNCKSVVRPQLDDDIGHFRQYIIESMAASNYTKLMKGIQAHAKEVQKAHQTN